MCWGFFYVNVGIQLQQEHNSTLWSQLILEFYYRILLLLILTLSGFLLPKISGVLSVTCIFQWGMDFDERPVESDACILT